MSAFTVAATQDAASAPARRRHGLRALAYTGVAGIGFAVDAAVLMLCLKLRMEPAWARVISLTLAMQATFWINGLFVFRCLRREGWLSAWAGYMLTNGFGNFCNYWVFVTLASLHRPFWSNHWLGLALGGLTAWAINYSCARFVIFGQSSEPDGCTPVQAVLRRLGERFGHSRVSSRL